ncbi:unnamed protein product [Trichobilharzia szidati]|nr:unnamed protein product [Trichobilharzia szidati]
MKLSTSSVVSESGGTSESKEVTKLAGSTSSLSVGLKTPETVKVPSEIEKTSQLPPTGSNPDLVRSSPAPTSTALKPEAASAKIESPSSKPSADKPVAADVMKSSDIMSKSYTQISKSDSPTRKMISGSKLPTSTTTTTSTPPIPTGIKMPINPSEISQTTAALSNVKAAAQKVDSENAPSELRDTSQKIPKTSVSAVPSGTGKYIPDTELELANLRAEVIEFREQIDALKAKREEDKNRIQELERVKIQLSQVEENRRRIRQQAAELQRESAQLKTEKAEVKEAFDRYREEVSEMVENIEMITLDKEMTEEKLERLTGEIELLKEQVEELTLENQILKEEFEEKVSVGVEGGPTLLQFKNLEQQNERMKGALVKLRDLVNQDKSEISALTKQITSLESEVSQLQTEKERLTKSLKDSVEQIIELKEQVDAYLGIDTMVSQLTQRNLELEETLEKIKEERNDLQVIDGEKSGVFCRQTNTSNINDSVFLSPSNNNSMNNIRRGIDDANNKTTGTMNRTPNRDMDGLKPPSLNAGMDSGNNMLTDKPVGSSIGRHNSMRSLAASNRPTSLSRTASVRRDRDSGLISKALGYMFGWS